MRPSSTAPELGLGTRRRSARGTEDADWKRHLPASWAGLVVSPITFDVFSDFEIAADRAVGYDEDSQPCYCAHRYVMTALRSDDDDAYYEAPVYGEWLSAWLLRDERWLIFRRVIGNYDSGGAHSFFSFSDSMPR